ncbi:MAG: hypothetical protein DIU78_019885 [Pseudomonadota bacterium]
MGHLASDLQIERERAYFNLGFEHGVAAALAKSRLEPVLDKKAKELAAELRERVAHASLAEAQESLVLLDVLWALIATRNAPHRR